MSRGRVCVGAVHGRATYWASTVYAQPIHDAALVKDVVARQSDDDVLLLVRLDVPWIALWIAASFWVGTGIELFLARCALRVLRFCKLFLIAAVESLKPLNRLVTRWRRSTALAGLLHQLGNDVVEPFLRCIVAKLAIASRPSKEFCQETEWEAHRVSPSPLSLIPSAK